MKCLLINYNRLMLAVNMANWLFEHGIDPVFIDNGSNYQMLHEYYNNACPYQVVRLKGNYGHTVTWIPELGILDMLGITGEYMVSDPDLDLTGAPDDFLSVLQEGLRKYPTYDKCALSLEINDLPHSEEGDFIRLKAEARYWKNPLDSRYFHADTDTTIALYRAGVRHYSHSAIRTNRPYTCKHVPWYYTDFNLLSEEEQYYFRSANESSSGKKRLLK